MRIPWKLIALVVVVVLVSGCTQKPTCNKPYILVGGECCLDENDDRICDRNEVVNGIMKEETTITTKTEEEVTEKPEPIKNISAKVGCIPITFALEGNNLTIQAISDVASSVKTKSKIEYKIEVDIEDISKDIVVNESDLFVFYSKRCCEGAENYNSYRYFILAISDPVTKTKFIPRTSRELVYDYSSIEGKYQTYSWRENIPKKDIYGRLILWEECGDKYIISTGSESRKVGEDFRTKDMIDRLKNNK